VQLTSAQEEKFSKYLSSTTGFVWVLEILKSPGILSWHFPGLENPGDL